MGQNGGVYVPMVRLNRAFYDDHRALTPEPATVDYEKTRERIAEHLTMTVQLIPHTALKRQFIYVMFMVATLLVIVTALCTYTVYLGNHMGFLTQNGCEVVFQQGDVVQHVGRTC